MPNLPNWIGQLGLTHAYHITPLHYLPAIAHCRRLRSKRELADRGYGESHFRSTSHSIDRTRGFEGFVHLSTRPLAPIALSKLDKGFPHLELRVPIGHLPLDLLYLCRYNIARHRVRAFAEGPETGRLRNGLRVPTAKGSECAALMRAAGDGDLEVLFEGGLDLPDATEIRAFHAADLTLAAEVAAVGWRLSLAQAPAYPRRPDFAAAVEQEFARFQRDASYRGCGLEFDRFKDEITLLG